MTKEEKKQLIVKISKETIEMIHKLLNGKPLFTTSLVNQIKMDEIIEAFRDDEFESISKSAKRYKKPKRTMYRITEFARKK
jgi:hypothetical protein